MLPRKRTEYCGTGLEREDLALKIYLDKASFRVKVQELQLLKKRIEVDEERLRELIGGEGSKLEQKTTKGGS